MASRKKLTATRLAHLREALQAERTELLEQVVGLDSEADVNNWRDGGYDDDPADTGAATVERERAQSLSSHARGMLDQINGALARLDRGDYGTCQRCGNAIEVDRLEALPYATMCMSCKRQDEQFR